MPITPSARKKQRQDKKRHIVNLKQKEKVLSAISAFKKKPTRAAMSKLFSSLDMSAKKDIFHPRKTARLKSRLSRLLKNKP
ncbi:30S ribosomal protein S20 [Candidatus Gottesmanbacteria bacterium]|nr:30S ribosomal protein S20 [Candidatus Gottesmanbacteria bacterium]